MGFGNLVQSTKFKVKEHSPEILVVSGIVGVIVSTVLACRASSKVPTVLKEHEEKMDEIRDTYKEEDPELGKETTKAYVSLGMKFVKMYAPSVALGTISICGIIGSNRILRKRNLAITAAYMALNKGFKEYRDRVIERFGDNVDYQLRHNVKDVEVEEKTVDEKGKEKVKKKKVTVADANAESMYVKYFTKSNPNWSGDPEQNLFFFKMVRSNCDDILTSDRGYITLNEVYEKLGFKATQGGFLVGWFYDKQHPVGDNRVLFDIKEVAIADEQGNIDWGYSIDFNVDGIIYDHFK